MANLLILLLNLYFAMHSIQTAPAAAKLAASLLLQRGLPADLKDAGFDLGWVSPLRLAGN
jgi:D-arginine dehydrogenase